MYDSSTAQAFILYLYGYLYTTYLVLIVPSCLRRLDRIFLIRLFHYDCAVVEDRDVGWGCLMLSYSTCCRISRKYANAELPGIL